MSEQIRPDAVMDGVDAVAETIARQGLSSHEAVGVIAAYLDVLCEASDGDAAKVVACIAYQLTEGDRARVDAALDEVWKAAQR